MNITDVDDKVIKRALERGQSMESLTTLYTGEFQRDMQALGVTPPDRTVPVTTRMEAIVAFIQQIIENGYAYVAANNDVYFDIEKFTAAGYTYGYMAPANRNTDEPTQTSDTVDSLNTAKRGSRDFVLWKASTEAQVAAQEPSWVSPWGSGRPGWHVECSAICYEEFGDKLTMHSGGIDLCFPHHTNEIAQCQAYFNKPPTPENGWTNVFLHTGHLHIAGQKMSKSLKNFVTVEHFLSTGQITLQEQQLAAAEDHLVATTTDRVREVRAQQFRLFCLQHKYNDNTELSEEEMGRVASELTHLQDFFRVLRFTKQHCIEAIEGPSLGNLMTADTLLADVQDTRQKVLSALCDDFDTPRAYSALRVLSRATSKACLSALQRHDVGLQDYVEVFEQVEEYAVHVCDMFGLSAHPPEPVDATTTAFVSFRSQIRSLALTTLKNKEGGKQSKAFAQELLTLCDETRDGVLKDQLGMDVRDYTAGKSDVARII
jgi:cysteinyl-tRNA synthetase